MAVAVVIPIAEPPGGEAILGLRLDVIRKPTHHVKVVAQHLHVARPLILLPRQQYGRRAPLDGPVERTGEPAGGIAGGHRQHSTAGLLGIADVAQDLVEPGVAVVAILETGRQQVRALQPPEFLAMRAVGQYVAGVRPHGPVDQPMRAVEQVAGTHERAGFRQARPHVDQRQRVDDRQSVGIRAAFRDCAGDLDELHAQVVRNPLMHQRLAVADQFAPDDVAAEQPVLGAFVLAATERDAVARLTARQFDPQLGRRILLEAVQEDAWHGLLDGRRRKAFERPERRPVLGDQRGTWCRRDTDRLPGSVIEAGAIPSRLLAAGVEVFPGEDVREHDRTIDGSPRGVRADALDRAVRLFERDFGAQQQGLVGLALRPVLVVAARRRIGIMPERVREHHADAIHTGLNLRSDI